MQPIHSMERGECGGSGGVIRDLGPIELPPVLLDERVASEGSGF